MNHDIQLIIQLAGHDNQLASQRAKEASGDNQQYEGRPNSQPPSYNSQPYASESCQAVSKQASIENKPISHP